MPIGKLGHYQMSELLLRLGHFKYHRRQAGESGANRYGADLVRAKDGDGSRHWLTAGVLPLARTSQVSRNSSRFEISQGGIRLG
jgi:hypothetical protein